MAGTYSIRYNGWEEGDDAYAQYAIDWSWKFQERWARSNTDGPGTRWYPQEGIDEKAYRALLGRFGLENYANEFPLERVITMSPAKLAAARREKERLFGLERKEILNSTLGDGYNQPAEEYK